MSVPSKRRLEFVAANGYVSFRTHLTLTYHARVARWEDDAERNWRIVKRSKKDLNRFLTCLRRELGRYLWVQEFQARGVVHYHVLCEGVVSQDRAAIAWCRATGEMDDASAVEHAVRLRVVEDERKARGYLGRYVTKMRQKCLPPGVDGAGRWWGRSRSLGLEVLEQVVSARASDWCRNGLAVRAVRCLRKYVARMQRRKFRGGAMVLWDGTLAERVLRAMRELERYYCVPSAVPAILADFGADEEEGSNDLAVA
jgi:hypothetical protein